MNAREMHYDFKQKLNKIDSQKYRGLKVPEIDWKLNEAQDIFIKAVAEPRLASQLGFEKNQRTISDIRTIVVNQVRANNNCITPIVFDDSSFIAALPDNFWFSIASVVFASKGKCLSKRMKVTERQHDDEHELSPFDRSSFEWREVNVRFITEGIRIFTDGIFTIDSICLDYIKVPRRIHNAQDYVGGTYTALDGTALVGSQSSELPVKVHSEVVDLAVLITSGDLSLPDYQLKSNKIQLTN